jgi:hypothetical protein
MALCPSPADLKIVVVPENYAATALRAALATEGAALINIEVLTPRGLALHIWKAVHPDLSFKYMGRKEAEFILGILAKQLNQPWDELFSSSISHIYESVQSIRMEKHSQGEKASKNASAQPGTVQDVLQQLVSHYEDYLQSHDRLDETDVLFSSISVTPQFIDQRHLSLLLVNDMVVLNRPEWELLNGIKHGVGLAHFFGSGHYRQSIQTDWRYVQERPQAKRAGSPPCIIASTRREEVRRVLSDILDRNIPFDRVEIACTDYSGYLAELSATCDRFNIPWITSSQAKQDEFKLLLCLRGYSDWVKSGYQVAILIRMIRDSILDVSEFEGQVGDVINALSAFPIAISKGSDPETWRLIEERAKGRRISKAQVESLRKFADSLSAFKLNRIGSVREFGKAFVGFASRYSSVFVDSETVTDFWHRHISFSEYNEKLESSTSWIAKSVLASLSAPGSRHATGLGILPITHAGYGSAEIVYVLGLDDLAATDSSASMEQMVTDGPGTEASLSARSEKVAKRNLIGELYQRYGEKLVLCAPSYDVASDRPLFPSSALIELTGMAELVPEKRQFWFDEADFLSSMFWKDSGAGATAQVKSLFEQFPLLSSGALASQMRTSSEWTHFDGLVSPTSDWSLSEASPSKLEAISKCPFQFFLSNVLRLKAPEESDASWLKPDEEGSLLHYLFEENIRPKLKADYSESADDEAALFGRLIDRLEFAAHLSDRPIEAQLERKKRVLSTSISLFLDREKELAESRSPIAVEFSFGNHKDSDAPSVKIALQSGTLSLSGRLDRLDVLPDGSFVVTDYKTGKIDGYSPKELKSLSQKLQWALYSLAVQKIMDAPVQSFEYFFPSARGGGVVRSVGPLSEMELRPVIERLVETYNSGYFIQAANDSACSYCDFKRVCGDLKERKEEVKQKFTSPSDQLTRVFSNWEFRSKMGGVE